jgi:hypothetical protein
MLVPAKMCNTLQYAEKQTQNPPAARSWGFDPPPGTKDSKGCNGKIATPQRVAIFVWWLF